MPTPVSYLSGASLSNTVGMFKRGTMAQNLKSSLESGYRWWNGIEVTSTQYLIYSDTYTLGTTTQANATPVAYSTPDLTDQSLLNLINTLPPRVGQTAFTSLPIALQWLQSSNKFFLIRSGTENIVKSGLQLYADAGRFDSYIGSGTTWSDLSSNGNNGTLVNGTGYNSSGVGSMVFDGSDDYVNCGNGITTTTQITVSAWVKLNVNNIFQHIVDSANNTWHLAVLSDGRLYFWDGGVYHTNGPILSTGKWYHVVGVKTATTNDIYVNGILGSSLDSNVSIPTNNVWIGRWQPPGDGRIFNGNISNVQIYDTALSPQQILQNYNTQKLRFGYYDSVQDGLVLNLDASNYLSYPRSGTTWTDLTGKGNNGTLTNGPTFSGGTTPSIVFDGSDDYVNLGTTLNNYQRVNLPYTMESFVYLNTSDNNEFIIGNTWDDSGFHIRKRGSSHPPANGIRFVLVQDGNNGCGKDSVPLTSGWYHIVGTYNGNGASTLSNYSLYINSSTEGTTDVSFGNPTSITPTNDTNIGRSGDATNYGHLNGAVSEVMIYNRVLTPQEVIQNFESQRVNFGITGITTNGLVLNLDAANNASYNGSGTTWVDISGSEFDGVLTNGPTYSNSGATSNISFDGTDDYVINSNFNISPVNNELSISLWYRTTNNANEKMLIDLCGTSNTSSNRDFFSIRQNWNSNSKISCYFNSTSGFQYVAFPNQVVTNTWNNIVYTKVGNTLYAYLNGSNVATQNVSGNIQTIQRYVIANDNLFSGNLFAGNIANVLIYNRGLSTSEVLQNYNAQKSRFGL
jgi:hypothetical protein